MGSGSGNGLVKVLGKEGEKGGDGSEEERENCVRQEGGEKERVGYVGGEGKYEGRKTEHEKKRREYEEMRKEYEKKKKENEEKREVARRYEAGVGRYGYGKGVDTGEGRPERHEEENGDDQHHNHEFGRRGKEMVRRLRRGLAKHRVGHAHAHAHVEKKGADDVDAKGGHAHDGDGGLGEGYMADLESLAVEEKEKGRRLFSFF
jgi:hypothetical protein